MPSFRVYFGLLLPPAILAASTASLQGRAAPSTTWLKPTAGTSFLWSLDRPIPSSPKGKHGLDLHFLQMYDVDLFDSTPEQIHDYKSQGKQVVCYFSAGSWEESRPDADDFNAACYCRKGDSCKMEGWDEWWFDVHSKECIANVQSILEQRITLAKSKGCDAVEPDNTDSYTNDVGFGTTIDDQLAFLTFLSNTSHANGLGVALKNGPDMIIKKPEIVNIMDFVLIEQCDAFHECDKYQPFVDAGKAAIEVEYDRDIECTRPGFFLLSYDTLDVNYRNVKDFCPRPSDSSARKVASIRLQALLCVGIFSFLLSSLGM